MCCRTSPDCCGFRTCSAMVLRMLPPRLTSGTRSSARTIRLQSILAVAAENADALTAGKAAVHLLHGAQEVFIDRASHTSAPVASRQIGASHCSVSSILPRNPARAAQNNQQRHDQRTRSRSRRREANRARSYSSSPRHRWVTRGYRSDIPWKALNESTDCDRTVIRAAQNFDSHGGLRRHTG